jgi:hypothetical protein
VLITTIQKDNRRRLITPMRPEASVPNPNPLEGCLKHRPVSRINRSHARWLTAAAAALVALMAATPARGAVTLGQIPASPPSPACSTTADYLQPSITGGNLYIARQAGTITSWSTNSSGGGAAYVFKVFRRTTDPDVFQVIAHAPTHTLTPGINTLPVNIAVRSGDMIGINESGPDNSCTVTQFGDAVLTRGGGLSDGASGSFSPVNDVRLNLSAVLVPSNAFTVASIVRDRHQGTATLTLNTSNPGVVTITGPGLKKHNATKNVAVAGPVQFGIAAVGSRKRRLQKRGNVTLTTTLTFTPSNGDPASQLLTVKLKKRRHLPSVQRP